MGPDAETLFSKITAMKLPQASCPGLWSGPARRNLVQLDVLALVQ